jgi:hypothetical protein
MLSLRAPRYPDYLPLTEFLRGSRRVAFLGATLGSLSSPDRPENAERLHELVRDGVPMAFGFVDPAAPDHVLQALAEWLGASPDTVRASLVRTARFFLSLRTAAGPYADRISVRGLQVLPSAGVALVDDDTPELRARFALYPMQGTPRYDPYLEGDRSTPEGSVLCDLCVNHFTRLMALSRDLTGDSYA